MHAVDHHSDHPLLDRRSFLTRSGLGFGGLALSSLLARDSAASHAPLITGRPHFAPKAKSVIWLFMRGGVSHMESFDPKPELTKYAGKTIAATPYGHVQESPRLKNVRVVVVNDANGQQRNKIYPLQVGYRQHGQSGIEVSDWFPHIGSCIDDAQPAKPTHPRHDESEHETKVFHARLGPGVSVAHIDFSFQHAYALY